MTELLHDLLDEAANTWPERPAVTAAGRTVGYRELADASLRVAGRLAELGVRRGTRLVAVAPSSPGLAALVYGCSRAGVAFSLLHEQVRGEPLRHVLGDCEPAAVILADPTALDPGMVAPQGFSVLDMAEVERLAFDPAVALPPAPPRPLAVDPVCLIYTSGTTALPKAVVSLHRQACFAISAIGSVLGYTAEDVVYCPLPLSFDYGLYQLFLSTQAGAHLWLGRSTEAGPGLPGRLVDAGATVFTGVPAVTESLARLLRRARSTVPALRLLTNTGAAMPPAVLAELREQIPGLRVQLMFGLTECKRVTIMPPDGDLEHPGASGLPLPGTEVLVVDDEGRPLPAGEVGQFVVRGPHVMAGYWRRPEANRERFPLREGLFPELHSGDYGWLDEDGYLYFAGRRDDIYKERGFRVSAAEVEAAARRVPRVASAVVVPPAGGARALLAVTGGITPEETLIGMRSHLEEFKIPDRCVVLAELPLTGNGKVDRKAVTALAGGAPRVHA